MYQMLQQLLSELPLHIALFACGAFGWGVTKWCNRRFCNPRTKVRLPTSCEELAAGLPEEAPETPSTAAPDSPLPLPRLGAPPSSEARRRERAKPAAATRAACLPSSLAAQASLQQPAVPDRILATEQPAGSVAISERVARLLEKKAQRKARKAEERRHLIEEQAALTLSEPESPEPEGQPAGDREQHLAAAGTGLKSVGRGAWSRITDEERPSELPPTLANRLGITVAPLVCETDIADLSTADEGTKSSWEGAWNEAEDSYEDNDDETQEAQLYDEHKPECHEDVCQGHMAKEEDCQPADWLPAAASAGSQLSWECAALLGADGQDDWMLPLEEMVVRQPELPQVPFMQQLDPNLHMYRPILSADGQQLYTDGEQVYMMACMEANPHMPEAQVMHPVVDPCDPLHEVVMGNAVAGASYWAPSPGPFVEECYAPGAHRAKTRSPPRPSHSEEDDSAWDVCWDFCP